MTTGRGSAQVIYSMRIACPKCSMQQTFRGTPPQIGEAVETWNSGHQLTAHAETAGAVNGSRLLVSPASADREQAGRLRPELVERSSMLSVPPDSSKSRVNSCITWSGPHEGVTTDN